MAWLKSRITSTHPCYTLPTASQCLSTARPARTIELSLRRDSSTIRPSSLTLIACLTLHQTSRETKKTLSSRMTMIMKWHHQALRAQQAPARISTSSSASGRTPSRRPAYRSAIRARQCRTTRAMSGTLRSVSPTSSRPSSLANSRAPLQTRAHLQGILPNSSDRPIRAFWRPLIRGIRRTRTRIRTR